MLLLAALLQSCSGNNAVPPPDCEEVSADRQVGANCIHRPDF